MSPLQQNQFTLSDLLWLYSTANYVGIFCFLLSAYVTIKLGTNHLIFDFLQDVVMRPSDCKQSFDCSSNWHLLPKRDSYQVEFGTHT